jgi:hypothetical protein
LCGNPGWVDSGYLYNHELIHPILPPLSQQQQQDDRPTAPLTIVKAVAFVNPFEESDRQFEDFIAARQAEREAEERFKKDNNALGFSRPAAAAK